MANNQKEMTPQPIHLLRLSGMILGSISIATVFVEKHASILYWMWFVSCCFLWPLIAFLRVKYSSKPINSERNNLVLDTFFVSSFIPLVEFNLLPSVLALTITLADKISSSARNVWFPSLFASALAILSFGFFTGFKVDIHSSTNVIISCFPLLILHTLSISVMTQRLVRNIRYKNKKLRELSSKDFLTGLYNKRYWQQQAEELIKKSQENNTDLVLILIDSDYFKQTNDRFGHLAGDEVLCEIGKLLLNIKAYPSIAGRFGGDEFALMLETDMKRAKQIAQVLKHQVSCIRLSSFPKLRCSVSIGLAPRDKDSVDFKTFFAQADQALYKAKNQGRNQIIDG